MLHRVRVARKPGFPALAVDAPAVAGHLSRMLLSLALPVLVLMTAAVLVTRGFEAVLPESLPGMAICLALASLTLWFLSAAGFAALYLWQGARYAALFGDARGVAHLATLGAKAALIWGPLVLLTVVTAPQRWKTARW